MHRLFSFLILLLVQACAASPPEAAVGAAVSWDRLEGWQSDRHAEAWPALLAGCSRLRNRADWRVICRDAEKLAEPTDRRARAFFESRFRAHPVTNEDGSREGLITGYYEPMLRGSRKPEGPYRFPLHAPPPDLLAVELGGARAELNGLQLRGRLQDDTVVPYPDRAALTSTPEALAGSELLWVDDAVDAFFLHVQGSGRVRLPDGSIVSVRYADHNGHPYRSIGARLIQAGELAREDVNLFSIRQWLKARPGEAQDLLNHNPRYIFFRLDDGPAGSPEGALNVPLTPGRSLAVDRERLPLGAPVWLSTTMPGEAGRPLNRLMMAQDTGSAIKGWNRADVFWGVGPEAEKKAGLMKEQGSLFVLLPR